MKDFFISYTSADREWAEWIAWQLEEAGYTVDIQVWDFRPSHDFIAEMDRASRGAERTLAVLTPKYFESRFTQAEWTAAFAKGNLLSVRVADFDVEGLLSVRVYIDLVGKDETQAKEALLTGVKLERAKPATSPSFPRASAVERLVTERPRFPRALPPIWNVPHQHNPTFVGRERLLDEIRETLTEKARTAIHGLGGVGKTQLAAEYAYRHAADYQLIWWIRAEEAATFASDYAGLAEKLELPEKDAREQRVIATAVRDWLNQNAGWLLVLDNARRIEDFHECMPQNRAGHVLITSRNPNWSQVARPLEVEVLDREQSVRFLLQRTGQTDEPAASLLADQLGDLPLALEQAGAYIETNGKPLLEYLSLFQTRNTELLRRGQPADYPYTVATTWEISFQELGQESPAAAGLLNLSAFLAPDDIPLSVLRAGAGHLPDELASTVADELGLDDIIAALRRYSLIERSEDSLSIHRLVQMIVRDRLSEEERRMWAERALRIVNDAFPNESSYVSKRAVCGRLLPHVLTVAESAEKMQVASEVTARLLNQTGLYLRSGAQYAEAKLAFERALSINASVFSPTDPRVATNVNNLGSVLHAIGDLESARECYETALRIEEAAFGPENLQVAEVLNNLGTLLRDLSDLEGARRCFERALAIKEVALGPEHLEVAAVLNNLGDLLQGLGQANSALPYFERALQILESNLGSSHPDVAIVLSNLCLLLRDSAEFERARVLCERALQIDEAVLGPEHPTVAKDINNLGLVLQDLGDFDKAREYYERALRIQETTFGSEHSNVATNANNLGLAMQAQGQFEVARQYFERALRIDEAALGPEHPKVAIVVNNLGAVLLQLGDLERARDCVQRALRIDEVAYGAEHPEVAADVFNLGTVLTALGQLDEARGCYERALHLFRAVLGENHPKTVSVRTDLETLVREMGSSRP